MPRSRLPELRKKSNAYLITGNIKHFPITPFIVTPKEMLHIIEKEKITLVSSQKDEDKGQS